MPESDTGHSARPTKRRRARPGGALLRRTTAGLVVLVLALAAASYRFDLGTRWFGWDYEASVADPAGVAPPPGLDLPAPAHIQMVAKPTAPQQIDPEAVRRAVAGLAHSRKLGRHTAVVVDQLRDGRSLYRYGPDRVTPASTMKLLTTTAALATLGPGHRFTTSVVSGRHARQIVLVGGGDPLLAAEAGPSDDEYPERADLATLARSTARTLVARGQAKVHLRYDTSLFTGPAVNPAWPATYIPENVVSPISPLWVDEGLEPGGYGRRVSDPARAAAEVFAQKLRSHHIKVVGKVAEQTARPGAHRLARVRSAPLREIVQHIIEVSDNEGAEVLLRHVALAEGRPASFAGGTRALRAVLDRLGIDTAGERIHDGSGLSRRDRLEPETLLKVLETDAAPAHPKLRSVVANLPVAGFTGTLGYRFEHHAAAGLGLVRAKTGTLTGVHSMAGVVTSVDGSVMAFAAVANGVKLQDTWAARDKLDQIAAALAKCRCAASGPASASAGSGASGSRSAGPTTLPSASSTP